MKHLPIVTILVLLLLTALPLRADRTLRGKLRPVAGSTRGATVEKPDSAAAVFDTIPSPAPETVRLSGYDKPLGSRVESLFVSNRLDRDIIALEITLTYRDLQGRTLHEATRRVRADIPAAATRRIQFPSWDTQNSFYYRHSRRPRTANVTPYDVTCTVRSCILAPPSSPSAEQNAP